MKISVICPSYNRASFLEECIAPVMAVPDAEFILVDDGSTDATLTLLEEMIQTQKIHVVHHATNRGAGAALETGFAYIRSSAIQYNWKYVVTFDADGQHNI